MFPVSYRHSLLFRRKKNFWFIIQVVGWNDCGWNIDDCEILLCSPPLTVFLALSLLLIAFSGSAKCFEPRPHPVHTQTRGAGERVRHTAVSRWVCCLCRTPTWTNAVHFWWKRGALQVGCAIPYSLKGPSLNGSRIKSKGLKCEREIWTAHLINRLLYMVLFLIYVTRIPWRAVLIVSEWVIYIYLYIIHKLWRKDKVLIGL